MTLVKVKSSNACEFCKKTLSTAATLRGHLFRRGKNNGVCPPLRIRRKKPYTVKKNKVIEHKCDDCGKKFKTEPALISHKKRLQDRGSCPGSKNSTFYRIEYVGTVETFFCNNCNTDFTNRGSMQNHVKKFRKTGVCPKRVPTRASRAVKVNKTCRFCQHEFASRTSMLAHRNKHDPVKGCAPVATTSAVNKYIKRVVKGKNTVIYQCSNCDEVFKTWIGIYKHAKKIVDGKCPTVHLMEGEALQPFNESRLKSKNPFWINAVFQEEPQQLGSPEHDSTLEKMIRWITAFTDNQERIRDRNFHGVYCAAVLGKQFKQGQNVRDFIKTNQSQVLGTYWGSCSGCKIPISTRHKDVPGTSVLAKAAMSGYHIAVLGHVEVGEQHHRLERVKRLEAMFIAATMTDAEFVPVAGRPQYPILNINPETYQLLDLQEINLKKMYKRGIKGIRQFCLDDKCNGLCAALLHPDWESNLIFPLKEEIKKKYPNVVLDRFIPTAVSKTKRQRPTTELQFKKEMTRKMQEISDCSKTYDPSHYLYTVVVVPSDKFPRNWGARKICREIIKRKDENLMVGVYIGVNGYPRPADHHHNENKHHSSIFKAVQKGGIPIVIKIAKFDTKLEARQEEATYIAYTSILQRWKVDGIKFELLNEHQEWKYLPLSNPTFKEKVGQALAGRQYVSLDGEGIIDLNTQIMENKVHLMEV